VLETPQRGSDLTRKLDGSVREAMRRMGFDPVKLTHKIDRDDVSGNRAYHAVSNNVHPISQ